MTTRKNTGNNGARVVQGYVNDALAAEQARLGVHPDDSERRPAVEPNPASGGMFKEEQVGRGVEDKGDTRQHGVGEPG